MTCDVMVKVCNGCKKTKLISEFYRAPQCFGAVRGECKKCRNDKEKIKRLRFKFIKEQHKPPTGMKCCSRCGRAKPLEEFYNAKHSNDGRKSECIVCSKLYRSISSPEQIVEWKRRENERNKLIPRRRLLGALRQAALRGAVHVTVDDLVALWKAQDGCCAVTGIKMVWEIGGIAPHSLSIDRIDSSGGYTADNIRLVCYQVNMFKNKWDDDQMFQMALAIVSNLKKPKLRIVS